jgi:hypothetical protein
MATLARWAAVCAVKAGLKCPTFRQSGEFYSRADLRASPYPACDATLPALVAKRRPSWRASPDYSRAAASPKSRGPMLTLYWPNSKSEAPLLEDARDREGYG